MNYDPRRRRRMTTAEIIEEIKDYYTSRGFEAPTIKTYPVTAAPDIIGLISNLTGFAPPHHLWPVEPFMREKHRKSPGNIGGG